MRELPRARRRRARRSTARARRRSPGSSTATRIRRSRATGRTSSRSAPRARRYEELLAAGGGILSTTRATRAAGADALREIVERHRDGMLAHGTTTFEGKSGYGLDHDTELAQLRRGRGGRRRADVARRARRAARARRCRRVRRLGDRRRPARRGADRRGRGRLRRARDASTSSRLGATCAPARDAGSTLRLHGDQLSEIGAVPLAVELGARSVDHLEATGADGRRGARRQRRRRRPAARRRALPRPADAACPRARRRGSGDRARDGLQPGQRVLREPAASCARSRARSSG